MVLNIDQTPLKYVPCGKTPVAEKSSSTVPINGVSDKRMITATFTISLDGKFLPIQLIYAGKTERSIPKIKFTKSFLLSTNPTHFSNETESLKLMKEIVIPYFQTERKKLGLAANHSGSIIMDVFKGQTTDAVQNLLKKNNIFFTKVPANMTNLFQPLDLTINGYAKPYLKKLFTEWFAKQITDGVNSGKDPGSIEVPLQLSILKPLQAKWIIKLYDEMTSSSGKEVILKGWERAGITDGIKMGSLKLPTLDPFHELDPLVRNEEEYDIGEAITNSKDQLADILTHYTEDSDADSEWEEENYDKHRNIFEDVF